MVARFLSSGDHDGNRAPAHDKQHRIDKRKKENTMRKVIVSEYVTLDGVMEDPGGAEGFKHGGWSFGFGGAEQQQYKFEELFACDALLLGRRTYEGFAAAWPNMPGTGAYGERMNSLPKYVVSSTLAAPRWDNSTVLTGDVAAPRQIPLRQPHFGVIFGPPAAAGLSAGWARGAWLPI